MNWSYNEAINLQRSSVTNQCNYSVNANSNAGAQVSGSDWGVLVGSIFNDLLGVGVTAYMMSQTSGAQSNKQISQGISNIVSQMPGKIATEVTNFNTKYGVAGVTIDATGKTSTTYDQLMSDLDSQISDIEKDAYNVDGDKKEIKQNYKDYQKAQSALTSLKGAKTSVESYKNLIKNADTKGLTIGADGKASVAEGNPNPADFLKFLPANQQTLEGGAPNLEGAKETQAYKNEVAALENKCTAYNSLVEAKNNVVSSIRDIDGNPVTEANLDDAISKASAKVDELGAKNLEGTTSTCAQHDSQLTSLKNRKAALGTKADFETAVKTIEKMNEMLQDAIKVQQEETDVQEAKTARKNARSARNKARAQATGSWWSRLGAGIVKTLTGSAIPESIGLNVNTSSVNGRYASAQSTYSTRHGALQTARSNLQSSKEYLSQQKSERDSAYAAFMEKYFSQGG